MTSSTVTNRIITSHASQTPN